VAKEKKAKSGKAAKEKGVLGPSTIVKPCLWGAGILLFVQFAMKTFLHA
jgi:hypothetical protein